MRARALNAMINSAGRSFSRRGAVRRLLAGGGVAVLGGAKLNEVVAQDATPATGECVATAPVTQGGIGLQDLLLEGLVPDMPAGPVRVYIGRFTLEPGALVEPLVSPDPAFMYIETGESMCPGGPGRVVYNPDGSVLDVSQGEGFQRIPTGTTQYIPGGVPDGASNQGTTLMSSLVIVFMPAADDATPAAVTPEA
jgi:hypothetical protein